MLLQSLQWDREREGGGGREGGREGGGGGRKGGFYSFASLQIAGSWPQAVLWPAEVQSDPVQYVTIHNNSWEVMCYIAYD